MVSTPDGSSDAYKKSHAHAAATIADRLAGKAGRFRECANLGNDGPVAFRRRPLLVRYRLFENR